MVVAAGRIGASDLARRSVAAGSQEGDIDRHPADGLARSRSPSTRSSPKHRRHGPRLAKGRRDVLVDRRDHAGVARLEVGTVHLRGLSPSVPTVSGTVVIGAGCSGHVSLQWINRMRRLLVLAIYFVPVVRAFAFLGTTGPRGSTRGTIISSRLARGTSHGTPVSGALFPFRNGSKNRVGRLLPRTKAVEPFRERPMSTITPLATRGRRVGP